MPLPALGRAGVLSPERVTVTDPVPSVEAQLAAINVKLDLLIAGKDDHETRLRGLEQFKWLFIGASAASGASAGAIVSRFLS